MWALPRPSNRFARLNVAVAHLPATGTQARNYVLKRARAALDATLAIDFRSADFPYIPVSSSRLPEPTAISLGTPSLRRRIRAQRLRSFAWRSRRSGFGNDA
jgi:hypothetical protein